MRRTDKRQVEVLTYENEDRRGQNHEEVDVRISQGYEALSEREGDERPMTEGNQRAQDLGEKTREELEHMIRKLRMKIEEQEENCRLSLEREHHPRIREEGETTRVEWDGESVIEPG